MNFRFLQTVLISIALAISSVANAGIINGGSDIINENNLSTLSSWLGYDDIELTNIYTRPSQVYRGISSDWHAAVDGQGATFTLMTTVINDETFVFGGYNPNSWDASINGYTRVAADEDDSFVFSLTRDRIYERASRNTYSVQNKSSRGATWSSDLLITGDLEYGAANLGWSYGNARLYGNGIYRQELAGKYTFDLVKYETFTITEIEGSTNTGTNDGIDIPEPSTLAIFALGMFGLVLRRVKKSL